MIVRLGPLALGAVFLSTAPRAFALSPSDIPADTPVSQLVSTANANLAAGNAHDALAYFDAAVSRDPQNYLTLFKRGATYLSLGKTTQAHQDFDRALAIKPNFDGALLQRAKIKSRNGDWAAARKDYEAAGKGAGQEIVELEEAQGAAALAADAAKHGDWEACVDQAGVAVMVAGAAPELRKLRARCRFERGDVAEGVSDLQHLVQMSPGSTEPHLQISAMTFYSLGETERGLSAIRKCLQSDPDSKSCRQLMKREKALEKDLKKVRQLMEKRQFGSATRLLAPTGDDAGLLQEVKDDIKAYKAQGIIHRNAPGELYDTLLETTCDAYVEANNPKRAGPYCTELLAANPTSLPALLHKAQTQLDADDFDGAIRTLTDANQHHPRNERVQQKLNEAGTLAKRAKQKDYYKVLGVARDASDRDVKRAYRQMSKLFHPDKAGQQGIAKDDAERKMAAINEAYEVLSDPELRARFDRGDDPNSNEQQGAPFHGSPFGHGPAGAQWSFQGFPGGGFPGGGYKFQGGGGGGGFRFHGFPGGVP